MTATITSPTEPQIAQVKMLVEHVVRQSGVDFDGLQLLLTRGGEFQRDILPLIHRYSRKEENPYADEHEEQSANYPDGWRLPTLAVQADRLASAYPGLDLTFQDPGNEPMGDGFALIPKLSAIARIAGIEDPYGAGYGPLVEYVLGLFGQSRKFYNYREGTLTSEHIRLHAEVREIIQQREAATPGDCLVLPVSFGNDYAGWSARAAGWEALHSNQLPLDPIQVASLLMASPDRLVAYENLFIDCPGAEYDWYREGGWSRCPYFHFRGGRVEFDAYYSGGTYSYFGSAVAFLGV